MILDKIVSYGNDLEDIIFFGIFIKEFKGGSLDDIKDIYVEVD